MAAKEPDRKHYWTFPLYRHKTHCQRSSCKGGCEFEWEAVYLKAQPAILQTGAVMLPVVAITPETLYRLVVCSDGHRVVLFTTLFLWITLHPKYCGCSPNFLLRILLQSCWHKNKMHHLLVIIQKLKKNLKFHNPILSKCDQLNVSPYNTLNTCSCID